MRTRTTGGAGLLAGAAGLIFLLFFVVSLSCQTGLEKENNQMIAPDNSHSLLDLSLAAVKSAPQDYEDKTVTIAGVFKGWKGMCRSSFAITRSDWLFEDTTDCIYVSGMMPSGVTAWDPKDERLVVTGTIKVNEAGHVHLKALAARKALTLPEK